MRVLARVCCCHSASVRIVSPPSVVKRSMTALLSSVKPGSESSLMARLPRNEWSFQRMLLRAIVFAAPSWMLSAQRPFDAISTVLLSTRLPVDGPPPSIWYSEMPLACSS